MLELKSDLKPRQMIGLNDRTRLIVYLALQSLKNEKININTIIFIARTINLKIKNVIKIAR